MVKIFVNGQDKTQQIQDWKIFFSSKKGLLLRCCFPSGKNYTRPLDECEVVPTEVKENALLVKKGGCTFANVDRVVIYGQKYAVVQYPSSDTGYLMNMADIQLVDKTALKSADIFLYFKSVAQCRVQQATSDTARQIAENVVTQMDRLPEHAGTALSAFCTGQSVRRDSRQPLLFPFGINESQLAAVAGVFSSQVSVIEGPPGTGKTQTILNILANILLRGETVAILSNNNTAVENIYEKLEKEALGYLIARLGSRENREAFFIDQPSLPEPTPTDAPDLAQIDDEVTQLKELLEARNRVATLRAEIDELTIERKQLLQWQADNLDADATERSDFALQKYGLSAQQHLDLMAYLALLDGKPFTLRNRIALWFNFRILRTGPINRLDKRHAFMDALQRRYYDLALHDKREALASSEAVLERGLFDDLLARVTASSMACLKSRLQQRSWPDTAFDAENYRSQMDDFLKRYPIVGSGTHSIVNSLQKGTVLDYVIIDEASQQDIVPGILALGCARNLVIVGDRKQLPPVFTPTNLPVPDNRYDCDRLSLLDSCLQVFGDQVPVTLLKEHYRCHPRIIQFCNQQFYKNQLIPMTRDAGEDVLRLIVTAKGNHSRGYKNQRELDSLTHLLAQEETSAWDEACSRGFIAPYNAQVKLSESRLSNDFVKATTHKFQGRECDEIVFSTVLDKKNGHQRNLSFVDDPNLINVAVSRAKHKFTLVTGEDVFSASNGPIAALIRYMEYYAEAGAHIYRSPVVSAFDLLYSEYDRSLESLKARLKRSDSDYRSEQIVAQLLRECLKSAQYESITFHREIALNQLVSVGNAALSDSERGFMQGRSRCDFVLYYRVGKKPLGVIEVDGASHMHPQQREWDRLKNGILQKGGLPLLRLNTTDSHIEAKIERFIHSAIGVNVNATDQAVLAGKSSQLEPEDRRDKNAPVPSAEP